jgi:hypothetical protein
MRTERRASVDDEAAAAYVHCRLYGASSFPFLFADARHQQHLVGADL